MSKNHILHSQVSSNYLLSQTTIGRWRLSLYILWKRLAWNICTSYLTALKRCLDVAACSLGLIILSPLFFIIALLIKLEDGGPIFFHQTRVGKYGREFKMFKFRSMFVDAEARLLEVLDKNHHGNGITFKIQRDPRITRIGVFIRKWSLDELPQLVNVLKGDMSLVGPRPPIPREVSRYSLNERKRLEVTPGITCFWQVMGRSNISFPEQVKLDVQYIESQSLGLDLKILQKTIPAVISGKGAY
jgi:lipopolysaccharide/colanic/teichoic acid biosynthesis glycosyltransferase